MVNKNGICFIKRFKINDNPHARLQKHVHLDQKWCQITSVIMSDLHFTKTVSLFDILENC